MKIEPGGTYRQIDTDVGRLVLCNIDIAEEMATGVLLPGSNRSVMLQFTVEDVDEEYERLERIGVELIKHPTTQPWGSRSVWFRDPDGNAIDLYCRPGEEMVNPPYALTHCCMVTEGVRVLGDFYMNLLGIEDSDGER